MSICKYPDLVVELENRIYSNFYTSKLPPYSVLQQEFSLAPATVKRALDRLLEHKLISTDSLNRRRGIHINNRVRTRKRGIIAIVLRTDIRHSALLTLEKHCRADGFEVEYVIYNSPLHFGQVEEMFFKRFAGVIFLFSSIAVELALCLKHLKIPFSAANYLPMGIEMDMVEWNHENCWKQIITELKEKNYHNLLLAFPGMLENYFSYQMNIWQKLIKEHGLQTINNKIPSPDRSISNSENIRRLFKYLHKKNAYPEALLIWNSGFKELIDELRKEFNPPDDMLIILPWRWENKYACRLFSEEDNSDYERLFLKAYHLLRLRMAVPTIPYSSCFLNYEIPEKYDFPIYSIQSRQAAEERS